MSLIPLTITFTDQNGRLQKQKMALFHFPDVYQVNTGKKLNENATKKGLDAAKKSVETSETKEVLVGNKIAKKIVKTKLVREAK